MNDTLTDRERELVEAAKVAVRTGFAPPWVDGLHKALCAYDPPKSKIPVLPTWDELSPNFVCGGGSGEDAFAMIGGRAIYRNSYNTLRELTAKDSE